MAAENRRLIDENRRIYQLSQDLEQLKSMDRRIRHALGAPVEAGGKADTVIYEVLERGSERTESIFSQYEIVFISPLEGLVTRGYQEDIFPRQSHRGIDLAVPEGTIVNAAADGWVLFSGWHPRYGKFLILQHWGDYSTFYGHLSAVLVEVGEAVKLGSPAAVSGNSGRSTAPHLHFEIRHRGVSLDPQNFIQSLSGMQYNITEKDSVSEEQFEADNLESMN